ncbi:MAG: class I SAM-dependent methyltransferase [Bacteroidia bacterium]
MNQTWNQRYAEKDFAYGVLPNEFLAEQLEKLAIGNILFPCEGEGRNAVYAALNGWNVTAFDFSEAGYEKANLLAKQNNIVFDYKIADALEIKFEPESFDVIAMIYAHFPVPIRALFHAKMLSWLKPNGIIILEAFNPLQLNNKSGGPKNISMLYTEEIIENDFKNITTKMLSLESIILNEGKYHQGKANVIRYIGIK